MPELVRGEGPIPADGMIVGMNPGEQEEIEGRPFVGRSGSLLNSALDEAGLQRSDIFVTNVYKVRTPSNREPTKAEIELHLDLLFDEFERVNPKVLLLLGNTVLHTFFPGRKGITKERGTLVNRADRKYIFTYHPAYVLRNQGVSREQFQFDVNLFARTLDAE